MKLDILVIAAHPDDAELSCSGTLIHHIAQGKKVGILDLTQGELGTRGTIDTRYQEAKRSSEILQLTVRDNLKIPDGFFRNDKETQLKLIQKIRQYQPEIILSNAIKDRHIDHGRASKLAEEVVFLAGLRKIETWKEKELQKPWRPKQHYHYIQDDYIEPDFVVDITDYWEQKMESIKAFSTQFSTTEAQNETAPNTPISSPDFIYFLEARARDFGRAIGVKYGEGFTKVRQLGVKNLFDLM